MDDAVTAVSTTVGKIIDKIFPDPEAAAKAKALLMSSEAQAEIAKTQTDLSAIMAEAQSADPWTSRARPSFLYIVYTFILAAIPMGVLYAFRPEIASDVADGVKSWLNAFPDQLYWLFGAGYLGYTGARSFDKWRGTK
ncbi:MAG: hypothetical protein IH626_01755 [Rhodospirillales bacterium]|nr:hypothetical protein [Rhodospirillales bacterium]